MTFHPGHMSQKIECNTFFLKIFMNYVSWHIAFLSIILHIENKFTSETSKYLK
jgi:hypothetical protein